MFEGLERLIYTGGGHIFREGTPGDRAYLIEDGSVEVYTGHGKMHQRVCILTEGELFGEVALIDNQPRTATVTALEETRVVSIPRDLLESKLAKQDPVVEHLLRVILKRFRNTQNQLSQPNRLFPAKSIHDPDEALSKTQKNLIQHITIVSDINDALKNNEFRLFYQPIISLKDNQLVGFEALLRWEHPEKGMIPPMEFLNVAEQTDQILPIGIWTLKCACDEINELTEHASDASSASPLFVSVNLPPPPPPPPPPPGS